MKRYTFTLEETQEIKAARKKNRDKNVEKRLAALEMRAEGKQNKEINKLHIPENIELFYIETEKFYLDKRKLNSNTPKLNRNTRKKKQ